MPAAFTQHTIVLPFNDLKAVKAAFTANKNAIAGIIVEPVPGNAGLYLPQPGYLEFLREIAKANGALLIFDEVMTGFRLAPGGAQEQFGIRPDLTCLGKIIGGGLPVGCIRRAGGHHGLARAAGTGLSGRDVERQPAGDGGGHRSARRTRAQSPSNRRRKLRSNRRLEQLGAQLAAWNEGGREGGEGAGDVRSVRLDVLRLFFGRAG